MPEPIPLSSFCESMSDWHDWDLAEYKLAICLGLLPPDSGTFENFTKYKYLWWSNNGLGNFLYSTLQSLVQLGILEFDEEERFRWNANFSLDSLNDT